MRRSILLVAITLFGLLLGATGSGAEATVPRAASGVDLVELARWPAAAGLAYGFTCAPSGSCFAVTAHNRVERLAGGVWRNDTPTGVPSVGGMTCPTATWCLAWGTSAKPDGDVSPGVPGDLFTSLTDVWTPTGWRPPVVEGEYKANVEAGYFDDIHALDCSSPTFCMAIGGTGGSATWNGRAWTARRGGGGGTDGGAWVSCSSPTFCMDTPANPLVEIWNGTSWRQLGLSSAVARDSWIGPVVCSSSSRCLAAGPDGPARWNGSTWSLAPVAGGPTTHRIGFGQIGCTSADYCLALGGSVTSAAPVGFATASTGQEFSAPAPLALALGSLVACASTACTILTPSGAYRMNAVACPTGTQALLAWRTHPGAGAPGAPIAQFATPSCWGEWVVAAPAAGHGRPVVLDLEGGLHGASATERGLLDDAVCTDPAAPAAFAAVAARC